MATLCHPCDSGRLCLFRCQSPQFEHHRQHKPLCTYSHAQWVAHIKLAASRAFLLVAYFTQTHEMLFDARARGLAVFGGVPARGIYDNMKTAVDKIGKGKQRSVNARFEAMTGHYLFDHEFCNRAAGWEKGIVEKNVQDRKSLQYLGFYSNYC